MNAGKCGLSGMSYTIRYCPDQDVINLQITAPLAGNVMMRRSGCSGVLLEESQAIAEPVPPSPVAVQPPSWMQHGVSTAVACSGEKALPSDSELCYQGTLLVETLSVRVLEHTENGGTVNMKVFCLPKLCNGRMLRFECLVRLRDNNSDMQVHLSGIGCSDILDQAG